MVKNILYFLSVLLLVLTSCSTPSTKSEQLILEFRLTHVSINSEFDGAIDMTITGGEPPYSILWSNGETSEDIINLSAGVYSVAVDDNKNNSVTDSVTLYKVLPLELNLDVNDVSTYGGADGSIDLTVTSGIPPFNYAWSNGDTTEDISNLVAANYKVTVTDQFEQSITDSAVVKNPTIATLARINLTDNLIFAQELGQQEVNLGIYLHESGAILVDSGYESHITRLENTLLVLDQNTVSHIICTHTDADHIGGNSIVPANGTIMCNEKGKFDVRASNSNAHMKVVSDEYTLDLDDEQIICYAMKNNGHSDADMFVYFSNSKVLFLGDEYLSGSFPSIFTGRGARVQNNLTNMQFVLDTFPQDVILVPGHGELSDMSELENYLKMLNETIDIVISHMQLGEDLDTIISENVLQTYNTWGTQLPGLDTNFWIKAIYYSYLNTI